MNQAPRRAYRSPIRQQQAERTRGRILDAARGLFAERGYEPTTIEAIADAAGVSVQSVYAIFGSKRGILAMLVRQATQTPAAEATRSALRVTADPRGRVRLAATIARQVHEARRTELELLEGAGVVAPELAAVEREVEGGRRERAAPLIEFLVAQRALRADLDPAAALDVLWCLTGADLYRKLVDERGWSGSAYESLVAELLLSALVRPGATSS